MNDYTPPKMAPAHAVELARVAANPMDRGARMSLGPHVFAALVDHIEALTCRLGSATAKLDQLEARALEDARLRAHAMSGQ